MYEQTVVTKENLLIRVLRRIWPIAMTFTAVVSLESHWITGVPKIRLEVWLGSQNSSVKVADKSFKSVSALWIWYIFHARFDWPPIKELVRAAKKARAEFWDSLMVESW